MRIKVLILMLFSCLMISGLGFASDALVTINDQLIVDEGLVVVENGIPYGLVSDFAQRMNIEVEWLQNAKLAVLTIDGDYLSFKMDSNLLIINNKSYEMKHNSFADNGRIYIPFEVLAEKLGITYQWDATLLHMTIQNSELEVLPSEVKELNYTDDDLLWLSRIIEAETRGGSLDKKTAVANVVLNRVNSTQFPNSIYEVIFQRNQFPPAYKSGFMTKVPSDLSVAAAKRALMGVEVAKDCLYFNYIPFATKTDSFYKLIEGDYFYY
ncbi:cell wall hydrolase [Fusibacter bizertensis]|uniref:Cell wall hydrolase n=1 Tax=Fusibacter bizertensis TaxID=1488331 RepID=A0ABT6NEZ9_9FIRM|nr:cell wall hydrolase [Fusibacter bizertensis]MDH8678972.1 cell wall hydrolase [Fusibacter bizertensis]